MLYLLSILNNGKFCVLTPNLRRAQLKSPCATLEQFAQPFFLLPARAEGLVTPAGHNEVLCQGMEKADQFGSGLSKHEAYRGKDWSKVESDAQKDWEDKNPGTWSRVKDSIQSAWERTKAAVG